MKEFGEVRDVGIGEVNGERSPTAKHELGSTRRNEADWRPSCLSGIRIIFMFQNLSFVVRASHPGGSNELSGFSRAKNLITMCSAR